MVFCPHTIYNYWKESLKCLTALVKRLEFKMSWIALSLRTTRSPSLEAIKNFSCALKIFCTIIRLHVYKTVSGRSCLQCGIICQAKKATKD